MAIRLRQGVRRPISSARQSTSSTNIPSIRSAAVTGQSASEMLSAAPQLSRAGVTLGGRVDGFLKEVRAM